MPFPSQVFLTLLGLPLDELPTFLTMKDGIIRPDHVIGEPRRTTTTTLAYQNGDRARRSTSTSTTCSTSARSSGATTSLSRFLDAEVDGHRLTREDILDICFLFLIAGLDTVTRDARLHVRLPRASTPSSAASSSTTRRSSPSAVEELLRWETPVMGVVRVATEDTELGGCPVKQGRPW